MPVGELVATIDCNDSQALSDENIDGLRSACHEAAVPLDGDSSTNFPLAQAATKRSLDRPDASVVHRRRTYLRERLKDYPDQHLVANLLKDVNGSTPIWSCTPCSSRTSPRSQSLGPGGNAPPS